jgi:zinc and cadmium transporter
MEANLGQVVIFSLLGGVVSLIGGALLISKKNVAEKLAHYATPFAGGALLAAVFLDLLKEGIEASETETVLMATVAGILLFFIAEGFLHWFHHHHEHSDERDPKTSLIIVGDTLHNALDGVAIAASFLISVPTGIVTTIAVAAHEIPQEIGDFGLLLSKGLSRKKVLLVNFISALATVLFAVITFSLGSEDALPIGLLLGLSAGFLLYIALSDVIPTIHHNRDKNKRFSVQAALLILGAVFVGVSIQIAHNYIETDTHHAEDSHQVEQAHDH